jgi:hypothetical protein
MAAVATKSAAGDRGMVVVAMGGGSLKDALFNNSTSSTGDATFSFFAGYDKHGNFKGHVSFKRLYPGVGVKANVSTEITNLQGGIQGCPWVRMEGIATHHAPWADKPIRNEKFELEAWDCEGIDDVIWFRAMTEGYSERPALTLYEPTDLTGGNVMIR